MMNINKNVTPLRKIKSVKTKTLIDTFKYELINPEHADLEREIKNQAIHRAGLELVGARPYKYLRNAVISWGTTEHEFFKDLPEEQALEAIKRVITKYTPLLVISDGIREKSLELILRVSNELKTPVIRTGSRLSGAISSIGFYLATLLLPVYSIHASAVVIHGVGVMIIGNSGVGKSEAVLELIQKNHLFVSDDTVEIRKIGNDFFASPNDITEGILEARGLGLLDVKKMYGINSFTRRTKIDLVIELVENNNFHSWDRVGTDGLKYKIGDNEISMLQIPVVAGRSTSTLIEAAAISHIARLDGVNPEKKIESRFKGEKVE